MFGPRPPSSPAHWTTIPSHWAWESGLFKSRQSGLKYSQAQKQTGANTVGWKNQKSGDECPAFLSNSAEEEEKDGAERNRIEWQEMLLQLLHFKCVPSLFSRPYCLISLLFSLFLPPLLCAVPFMPLSRSSYCSILMDLSLARRCVQKRNIVTWPILLQQGSSISMESVNK